MPDDSDNTTLVDDSTGTFVVHSASQPHESGKPKSSKVSQIEVPSEHELEVAQWTKALEENHWGFTLSKAQELSARRFMPKDLIEYTKEAIFEFIKWDMNTVVENIIAHLKSYKEESDAKLEDRKDFVSKEAQMVVSRMKKGEQREVWGRIDALIAHRDIAAFVNNYQPTKTERKVGEVNATGAYEELMRAEYNSLEDYESGSS